MDTPRRVFSSGNWLLNFVAASDGRLLQPLDPRVRTHFWIYHHFFSDFAESYMEAIKKEYEAERMTGELAGQEETPDHSERFEAPEVARKTDEARNRRFAKQATQQRLTAGELPFAIIVYCPSVRGLYVRYGISTKYQGIFHMSMFAFLFSLNY